MTTKYGMYIPHDSGMHRLHPLTNITITMVTMVLGFALPGMWTPYFLLLLVIVPLALWSGVLGPVASSTLKIALPYAISLLLIRGLIWPGGTPVLELGPISFKEEGILFALSSTGRIALIMASFLLLTYTTRPDMLMLALTERGVPYSISYVVLSAMQIVPRFQAKANTILDAQRSRGLETEGGLGVRIKALFPLVQPLILGSIVDIEERAIALEVRGFGKDSPKTSLLELHDTTAERVLRWALLLLVVAVIVWRIAQFFIT